MEAPPPAADTFEAVEKRAAVIRRGAEREKRDLFATRPPDFGSVKQTLAPPPPSSVPPPSNVGARNENSVLFRVDQLRATGVLTSATTPKSEAPPPLSSPPASAPADDDGMIDLMALSTRSPAAAKGTGAPMMPLFSEAPPAAFARDATASAAATVRGKQLALIGAIAGGALALVLAIVGVVFAFGGDDPPPRRATAAAMPPPAPPPPVATPAPPPEPAAATTTASAAEEEEAKPAKPGKKGKGKGFANAKGGKHTVGAGMKTTSTPAPAPRPLPKAADPCHCKGDFNCILACSAKGHK